MMPGVQSGSLPAWRPDVYSHSQKKIQHELQMLRDHAAQSSVIESSVDLDDAAFVRIQAFLVWPGLISLKTQMHT